MTTRRATTPRSPAPADQPRPGSDGSAGLDPDRLDELWDFHDPAVSEQRFRRELRAASGPAAAELTTQLARALGLQARFDEADDLLDRIDPSRFPPAVGIRHALERGRLRNSAGDPDAAVPLFRTALDRASAAGSDFLAADAAHMLAIADHDRAEEWTRHGLAIVGASGDPRCARWAGALHNNYGWTLHDAGRLEPALGEFEAALAAYRATGTAEQVGFARSALAECLRSLGRPGEEAAVEPPAAPTDDDRAVEPEPRG